MTDITHYTERRDALWKKCPHCDEPVFNQVLERNFYACPHCDHYSPMPAETRLRHVFDSEPRINLYPPSAPETLLESLDLIDIVSRTAFPDERGKLIAAGEGTISGNPAILVCRASLFRSSTRSFCYLAHRPPCGIAKKNTRLSRFTQATAFLKGNRTSRCNPN